MMRNSLGTFQMSLGKTPMFLLFLNQKSRNISNVPKRNRHLFRQPRIPSRYISNPLHLIKVGTFQTLYASSRPLRVGTFQPFLCLNKLGTFQTLFAPSRPFESRDISNVPMFEQIRDISNALPPQQPLTMGKSS